MSSSHRFGILVTFCLAALFWNVQASFAQSDKVEQLFGIQSASELDDWTDESDLKSQLDDVSVSSVLTALQDLSAFAFPAEPLQYAAPLLIQLYRDVDIPTDSTDQPFISNRTQPPLGNNTTPAAAVCTVTNNLDSGIGTLRQCILDAQPGTVIDFSPQVFSPSMPVTIAVQTRLPVIITNSLTIDASNAGVILAGTLLTDSQTVNNSGLIVEGANGVTIRGLQVIGFPDFGILVRRGAQNAVIGGSRLLGSGPMGQGNLLTNSFGGIAINGQSTMNNQIIGNFVGVDIGGSSVTGNLHTGIALNGCTSENVIGGVSSDTRNIISGNKELNLSIDDCSSSNLVRGNLVGLDVSGQKSIGNNQIGIAIFGFANTIGGSQANQRNVIGGHSVVGIQIEGAKATQNRIVGNFVGVDASGTYSISNKIGIALVDASQNLIGGSLPGEGNLVSGNLDTNILVQGTGSTNNRIMGNKIGLDVTGTSFIANSQDGIVLLFGAHDNVIGGTTTGERNFISGNFRGISIQGSATTNNLVLGNFVGPLIDGKSTLSQFSQLVGIIISAGAHHNQIGNGASTGRNIISTQRTELPSIVSGIVILDAGIGNQIKGNYIGTDQTGTIALGNYAGIYIGQTSQTVIGGGNSGDGNLISDSEIGITIWGTNSFSNVVQGNLIGVNISGTEAISNTGGILLGDGAHHNLIGGVNTNEGNLISGNQDYGIRIDGDPVNQLTTSHNLILGNRIGVDADATKVLTNTNVGIYLWYGATDNQIGGPQSGAGNIIASSKVGIRIQGGEVNDTLTTDGNSIIGNSIGTRYVTGSIPELLSLPNQIGIYIEGRSRNNIIGGSQQSFNFLSYNSFAGIWLSGSNVTKNTLSFNLIGLNGWGVYLNNGANNNMIGSSNFIIENSVGIAISETTTVQNQITRNNIYSNTDGNIVILPTLPLISPELRDFNPITNSITMHTCPNCVVELFACTLTPPCATEFVGQGLANAKGDITIQLSKSILQSSLSATVTQNNTTSPLFTILLKSQRQVFLPLIRR